MQRQDPSRVSGTWPIVVDPNAASGPRLLPGRPGRKSHPLYPRTYIPQTEKELQYFVEMAGGDGFRWVICCAMLFCVWLNCRVGMFGQEMTMLGCSVIEIMPSNGRLPAELIEAGYRSSQYGLVVFVLNNVTPQAINLVLDPVVRTMPLSIPGVLYIEIGDEQRVRDAITSASIIYFASNALYNLAASYGVSPALVYSDLPPQPNDTAELPAIHRQVPPPETVDWRRHSFHHVFAA